MNELFICFVANQEKFDSFFLKEVPDKELLRPLFSSQRVLSDDDIEVVSKVRRLCSCVQGKTTLKLWTR